VTILLGIATATAQVGVALSGPDGPLASLHVKQGRRHAEVLVPSIESTTRLAGIGMQQIGRIAVDVGPGLFTGLRVGVATAKALAAALDIPIVGCSSLELLAYPHRRQDRLIAAVVDAKRGEVFWSLYQPGVDGPTPVSDPTVSRPKTLVEALADRGAVLAVGEGARRYADALATLPRVELAGPADDHPSATVLNDLAATRPSVPLEEITPLYLRGAEVRIGWERRPELTERTGPERTGVAAPRG
jgi:tRNA threonylcarbamoyladenosine biosynthesis protein TsaB